MSIMLQRKVLELYRKILTDFYKAREDLEIQGRRFNSTLLFEIIGFLNRACVILFGDYGQGKTTSAELVGAIMAGLPYPIVVMSEIRGSPELTEEKIIAVIDLGRLQQGEVEVIWVPFVRSPVHVIDELTRIPEIKQSQLLEGIRTGRWLYCGNLLETDRSPLFATANFEDLSGGSFGLIPALMDRFALGLDASYPGMKACLEIAVGADFETKLEQAGLCDYIEEAATLLTAKDYDKQALAAFCENFKKHLLEAKGFTPLYADELKAAREQIAQVPLSRDAMRFMGFVTSALNFCAKEGQKRGGRFGDEGGDHRECPQDCKFFNSPCSWALGGGSRRQERDIVQTARALAWLLGDGQVELEHLRAVAPFCLWHRRKFSQTVMQKARARRQRYPLKLEAAFAFIDELHHEFVEMSDSGFIEELHAKREALREQAQVNGLITIKRQKVRLAELHPYAQDVLDVAVCEPVATPKETT